MQSLRWWRIDMTMRLTGGVHRGQAASRWGWAAPHVRDTCPASVIHLLESSRVFPRRLRSEILWFLFTNRSSLAVFWFNPAENTDSPKLMKNCRFKPLSLCCWSFLCIISSYIDGFVMNVNYHQQSSSKMVEKLDLALVTWFLLLAFSS